MCQTELTFLELLRLELTYFHCWKDVIKWWFYPRCPHCWWRPCMTFIRGCVPCLRRLLHEVKARTYCEGRLGVDIMSYTYAEVTEAHTTGNHKTEADPEVAARVVSRRGTSAPATQRTAA